MAASARDEKPRDRRTRRLGSQRAIAAKVGEFTSFGALRVVRLVKKE